MLYAIYARGGKAFAREPEAEEETPTEEKWLGCWISMEILALQGELFNIVICLSRFLEIMFFMTVSMATSNVMGLYTLEDV